MANTMVPMIKSGVRAIAAAAYYGSKRFLKRVQGKVVILMYHRVLTEKELNGYFIQPGMYVRSDVFEKQMQFLAEHFEVLPFAKLLDLWSQKRWDDQKRYCVITFDDGWRDNYVYAYPILKELKLPATIFVPTALIGTTEWPWPDKLSYAVGHSHGNDQVYEMKRERGLLRNTILSTKHRRTMHAETIDDLIERYKELSYDEIDVLLREIVERSRIRVPEDRVIMNWEEMEEMSHNNISFGSHTCSHAILTRVDLRRAQRELVESLQQLREKRINHIPVFCYPNGNYTQEIVKLVPEAGYCAAVTTRRGCEDNRTQNLFTLRRIGIHNDVTATIPLFTFHLAHMV